MKHGLCYSSHQQEAGHQRLQQRSTTPYIAFSTNMAQPHLTALPEELLNEIFRHFGHASNADLQQFRNDLANLSLTCPQPRASVISALFHTVTLSLTWEDDALVEPGLCRLLRQCPDLARRLKCVRIQTADTQCKKSRSHCSVSSIDNGSPSNIGTGSYQLFERNAPFGREQSGRGCHYADLPEHRHGSRGSPRFRSL